MKPFLRKSKYFNLVQFLKSSITGPCKRLNPRESFSNELSWHIESKGRIPDSFCFESSISVTEPLELQIIPAKLQTEFLESHESNALVLELWNEDLSLSRIGRSSDLIPEKKERKKRRERAAATVTERESVAADIAEWGMGNGNGVWSKSTEWRRRVEGRGTF